MKLKPRANPLTVNAQIAHALGRAAKVDEMLDDIGKVKLGMTAFDIKKVTVDGVVRIYRRLQLTTRRSTCYNTKM